MSLKRIDELFNFEKGVLQSSKCTPGKYDFITASSEWKTHKEYTHDCEALIFAAAASGSLGRTHYVNGKFISSDLCFIITPKDDKELPIDLKFYHLLFKSLQNDIVRNTKAGTSKEAIGLTSFGKYEIPYFSIEKQKDIKSKFLKVQELNGAILGKFNYQQDLLSQLRQSFLSEAMQGKMVKQDPKDGNAKELLEKIKAEKAKLGKKEKELPPIKPEEIPFDIPENWAWCRLGEISLFANNGIYKPESFYQNSGYISLRMFNIQNGKIIREKVRRLILTQDELKKYSLEENDILLNRVNSRELVGKSAIILETNEPMVFESMNVRLRLALKEITAPYINYLLLEKRARNYFYNISKTANGQVSINQAQIFDLLIPLPPASELNKIIIKLNKLMELCEKLEKKIQMSLNQNTSLLKKILAEDLGA